MSCRISGLIMVILALSSCTGPNKHSQGKEDDVFDLDQIRKRGRLIVATDFNSTNYFIYRGQPMGYTYELLQEMAEYLRIPLEFVVSNRLEDNFDCLLNGQCDLIAINLTITNERKKLVEFTVPHSQTRQVLVQRKPENWRKMSRSQMEDHLLRNQLDLAGKTIYVQENSAYAERMKNLSEEIGDSINYKEVPDQAEDLIIKVAEGKIDYTVCDENVALVNQTYYPDIDVATAVSFPQNLAWAVNKGADELRDSIDFWLSKFRKSARYRVIYNKYFKSRRSADRVQSDYYALNSGRISKYDDAIRKYAREIGWDWRLLASLIYQESRFDPGARSWAGATGLMQLMPSTARRFGVSRNSGPDDQIRAGIDFIEWLDKRFRDEIPDKEERIKFILASYNAGPGHVFDAMHLAGKYGKDPTVWSGNVEEYLLKKSNPEYYHDPVVKYGYCRGLETSKYVDEILERYEHYRNIIPVQDQPENGNA